MWKSLTAALVFSILVVLTTAGAQTRSKKAGADDRQISEALAQSKAQMLAAAQAYKESLEKLVPYYQAEVKDTTATLEKRKDLLDRGIVSKKELQETEQALTAAQGRLDEVNRKLTDADTLIAEAMASDQQDTLPRGGYQATAALIRYNGVGAWSLKDASKVEGFFAAKFGHSMPISAFGQTPVHDKLGFDHRDALDVAVQPDSAEGEALMAYLRSQGIPFIAFRHAVPGSATGAHIHVGRPSHRIAPATSPN